MLTLKNLFAGSFLLFSLSATTSFATSRYLVCGPDEDGCSRQEGKQYCACIPYNEQYGATPYCLDFDNFTCSPLAIKPDCDKSLIFPSQANCLAMIFQSEPVPPCQLKSAEYCTKNKMAICDESGNPKTCH